VAIRRVGPLCVSLLREMAAALRMPSGAFPIPRCTFPSPGRHREPGAPAAGLRRPARFHCRGERL